MLLRVGIDKGCGGALAPIFEDGSFEYIPIPERKLSSTETRTYLNTYGQTGKSMSYYLPPKIQDHIIHFDPEFQSFTYGDATSKRKYILKLNKDDLIVFYAGLRPYKNSNYDEALYIIGYFDIRQIIDFNQLKKTMIEKLVIEFQNNAHIKSSRNYKDLVIVVGHPEKSKLLDKAILISYRKPDKKGRPYHAVSPEMKELLGIQGSIQRSIPPRFIGGKHNLDNLEAILGIKKKLKDELFKIHKYR